MVCELAAADLVQWVLLGSSVFLVGLQLPSGRCGVFTIVPCPLGVLASYSIRAESILQSFVALMY